MDEEPPWPARRSGAEQRRMDARLLYDFEVECRRQGWGDPAFVYDEEVVIICRTRAADLPEINA